MLRPEGGFSEQRAVAPYPECFLGPADVCTDAIALHPHTCGAYSWPIHAKKVRPCRLAITRPQAKFFRERIYFANLKRLSVGCAEVNAQRPKSDADDDRAGRLQFH